MNKLEKLGYQAGDLLLFVSLRNKAYRLVYKLEKYAKTETKWDNDEKFVLSACVRRCSPKVSNYTDYVELPLKDFYIRDGKAYVQEHRIRKLTEKQALLEVL